MPKNSGTRKAGKQGARLVEAVNLASAIEHLKHTGSLEERGCDGTVSLTDKGQSRFKQITRDGLAIPPCSAIGVSVALTEEGGETLAFLIFLAAIIEGERKAQDRAVKP